MRALGSIVVLPASVLRRFRVQQVCGVRRLATAAKMSASGTRTESDTMGKVEVSKAVYWGAQTERSLNNFKIGGPAARMPIEIIRGAAPRRRGAARCCRALQRATTPPLLSLLLRAQPLRC